MKKFSKFISLAISLAIIVLSLNLPLSVFAESVEGFATQHSEIDFSNYVINNKDKGNTRSRNSVTADMTEAFYSVVGDGFGNSYLSYTPNNARSLNTALSDSAFFVNKDGTVSNENKNYALINGASYRVKFDYKLTYNGGNQTVVVCAAPTVDKSITTKCNSTKLGNVALSANNDWTSAEFVFTVPELTDSNYLVLAIGSLDDANVGYTVCLDNLVIDRVGVVNVTYSDGTTEELFGAPESNSDNMMKKANSIVNNDIMYSTSPAEKVEFPVGPSYFNDAAHTEYCGDLEFSNTDQTIYGIKSQHAFVDFSEYEVINLKEKGTTRSYNGTDWSEAFYSVKPEGNGNNYLSYTPNGARNITAYPCDSGFLYAQNATLNGGWSFEVVAGQTYKVTYDYKLSFAEDAEKDTVFIKAWTTGGSKYGIAGTYKTRFDNVPLKETNEWTKGEFTFTVPSDYETTSYSSLAISLGRGSNNVGYTVCLDNVAVDRLGSTTLVYPDNTTATLKGIGKVSNEYKYNNYLYSSNDVAEKVNLPEGYTWYYDAQHTQQILNTYDVDYKSSHQSIYGVVDSNSFKSQHVDVDFTDYVVENDKGNGTTRSYDSVNETFDNAFYSVEENDGNKYLQYTPSNPRNIENHPYDSGFLYSKNANMNAYWRFQPVVGMTYKMTFDYTLSFEEEASKTAVYVIPWITDNKTYISATAKNLLERVALKETSDWKKGELIFTVPEYEAEDSDSLAIAIGRSKNNIGYTVCLDNVTVDALGSIEFIYPNPSHSETTYGLSKSEAGNIYNKYLYSASDICDINGRTLPVGYYNWYIDAERTIPVIGNTISYTNSKRVFYASSTIEFDYNNDENVNLLDLVKAKKYCANSATTINRDAFKSSSEIINSYTLANIVNVLLGINTSVSVDPMLSHNLTLVFSDEFNSNSLDTTLWDAANGVYASSIVSLRTQDDQKVENGYLKLMITKQDTPWTQTVNETEYSGYFRTGKVDTKLRNFGYGYYEACYRYPLGDSGLCNTSFWLRDNQKYNEESLGSEIDINEGRMPDLVRTNIHDYVNHSNGGNMKTYQATENLSNGFHRYGLLWTEETIEWYLDGQLIRKENASDYHLTNKSNMELNLGVALMPSQQVPANSDSYDYYNALFAELDGQSMDVDYVRYYTINN